MQPRLDGRVAIVIGGGWNIGRAMAERFAKAGAKVVVASRRQELLDEAVAAIRANGGQALAVATDASKREDVERLVAQTVESFGPPDILVAGAGRCMALQPIDEVDPDEWRQVFLDNVMPSFLCARSVLPHMRAQNRGVMIMMSGGGAFHPMLDMNITAYASAKAALCRFTDQLQAELLDTKIRIFGIEPGQVWSPMKLAKIEEQERLTGQPHPARKLNRSPEDAAELAHWLVSDYSQPLRGRVLAVHDGFWRDPQQVHDVEQTVHLFRLRRHEL